MTFPRMAMLYTPTAGRHDGTARGTLALTLAIHGNSHRTSAGTTWHYSNYSMYLDEKVRGHSPGGAGRA